MKILDLYDMCEYEEMCKVFDNYTKPYKKKILKQLEDEERFSIAFELLNYYANK